MNNFLILQTFPNVIIVGMKLHGLNIDGKMENIIHQNNFLTKSKCDMHSHCYLSNYQLALIDQIDEFIQ